MFVSLHKTFLLFVMTLVLLAGLFYWNLQAMVLPTSQSQSIGHVQPRHTLAMQTSDVTCPPPPYLCW